MAKRLFWAAVALLALTGTLRADVPPGPSPRPAPEPLPPLPPQFARPQPNRVRLVFRFDGPDAQTHLRLPSALLKTSPNEAQVPTRGAWMSPTSPSLIVAGLAITLSVVTAGLWLTRWRNRRLLGGGVLLGVCVLFGVSGCPWNDDRRSEMTTRSLFPMVCRDDGRLDGEALLERGDGPEAIQLLINRDDLTKFADRATAPK